MSSVVVTLDTTPPVITFGAYANAEAGFTFQIAYTCTDAASASSVTSATISNRWGQSLPMQIAADSLSVDLPSDWYDGAATITATGADEVGNVAPYATQVPISGAPDPTPPPTPSPGYLTDGSGGVPLDAIIDRSRRVYRSRSRVGTRTSIARRRRVPVSGHVARSRQSVAVAHHPQHAVAARTHHRLTSRRSLAGSVSGRATTTIQRRDDPGTELALLDLGVL